MIEYTDGHGTRYCWCERRDTTGESPCVGCECKKKGYKQDAAWDVVYRQLKEAEKERGK